MGGKAGGAARREIAAIQGGDPGDINAVFRIDPATAIGTYVGTPTGLAGDFLAVAFNGATIAALPANNAVLYGLNPAVGQATSTLSLTGSNNEGALGLGVVVGGANATYVFSGCCGVNVGNDIYRLDGATGIATLLGSAGGTRRVHDFVLVPAVGPAPIPVVEVPALGKQGITALALVLGLAGAILLKRR